jgi:hypothetical protein
LRCVGWLQSAADAPPFSLSLSFAERWVRVIERAMRACSLSLGMTACNAMKMAGEPIREKLHQILGENSVDFND